MNKTVIVVIVLMLYLYFIFPKSRYNTRRVDGFNVSRLYNDKESSRAISVVYDKCRNVLQYIDDNYACGPMEFNCVRGFTKLQLQAGVHRALENFKPENIYEIAPDNVFGDTAYTENKKTMMICLRKPDGKTYDINTLMFVALHEISHMINDTWDHDLRFWQIFRFVLKCANECGNTCSYVPVDYSGNKINYCGLEISMNPFYS